MKEMLFKFNEISAITFGLRWTGYITMFLLGVFSAPVMTGLVVIDATTTSIQLMLTQENDKKDNV